MMPIQDARDMLFASKEKAAMIYEESDNDARQAIDYLFVLMDIELIKLQKAKKMRCSTCDGTGMVHRADGEYMGECGCDDLAKESKQ